MKPVTAVALAAAVLALAACGQPSGASTASTSSSSPASCHTQYQTWKHGPAKATADRLVAALRQVQSAAGNQDVPLLDSGLSAAGKDAAALRAWPIPRCADPKGYYALMLARITAAGDNAKSAGGLGGLLLAMGPLRTVPGIEGKLSAELDRTAR